MRYLPYQHHGKTRRCLILVAVPLAARSALSAPLQEDVPVLSPPSAPAPVPATRTTPSSAPTNDSPAIPSPSPTTTCAACKHGRRKCPADCAFAPYFPANRHIDYVAAHELYGRNHIISFIKRLPPGSDHHTAISALVYDAHAFKQDPTGGSMQKTRCLERQIKELEAKLSRSPSNNHAAAMDTDPLVLETCPGGGTVPAHSSTSAPLQEKTPTSQPTAPLQDEISPVSAPRQDEALSYPGGGTPVARSALSSPLQEDVPVLSPPSAPAPVPATRTTPSVCAACKTLKKKCTSDCKLAVHFPAARAADFANAHSIFGASNIKKFLRGLSAEAQKSTVEAMVYDANALVRDPTGGSLRIIWALKRKEALLEEELAALRPRGNPNRQKEDSPDTTSSERQLDCLWLAIRKHGPNWSKILEDSRFSDLALKTSEQLKEMWDRELSIYSARSCGLGRSTETDPMGAAAQK